MSSYRRDDHRHSSSSRRDDSRDRHRRRPSPGPSRGKSSESDVSSRDENALPEQFGRIADGVKEPDYSVLQRMKKSFASSPLGTLNKCIDGSRKVKVWTRNYKEVRGICTGYVLAFDKHWNLIMTDVDEVYLRPRRAKTPYLSEVTSGATVPELGPKVPRKKKEKPAEVVVEPKEVLPEPDVVVIKEEPDKEASEENADAPKPKKKKKKNKKKGPVPTQRNVKQMFVRGDNIVMISVLNEEEDAE